MATKKGVERGSPVGFYADDAARIASVVRIVERESKGGSTSRGYRRTYIPNAIMPAQTKSGGITAGTKASPSSNTVTLLIPSGTGDGLMTGTDVSALNYTSRTVTGANKLMWVFHFNGKWVIPLADC